ncbi:hypothetical protein B0H14DRAFT_3428594 [Mycena olivaceomarginata]|nr:hypothetical protein B0H14DRAFT_3428594 [Mycena olivaceomarginata]
MHVISPVRRKKRAGGDVPELHIQGAPNPPTREMVSGTLAFRSTNWSPPFVCEPPRLTVHRRLPAARRMYSLPIRHQLRDLRSEAHCARGKRHLHDLTQQEKRGVVRDELIEVVESTPGARVCPQRMCSPREAMFRDYPGLSRMHRSCVLEVGQHEGVAKYGTLRPSLGVWAQPLMDNAAANIKPPTVLNKKAEERAIKVCDLHFDAVRKKCYRCHEQARHESA